MKKIKLMLGAAAVVAMPLAATPASALTIVLNNQGGVEVGTDAYNGFRAAAAFWESVFTNDVRLKLDVGFASLAPGVLAQAGSARGVEAVGTYVNALQATGTTNLDFSLTMPNVVASNTTFSNTNGAVDAIISGPRPDGTGVALPLERVLDDDRLNNNSFLAANTSTLKAVGLQGTTSASDAGITFSSDFAFDFDPTDGVTAGAFDFIGIAIHEIGHALGFVSGVDVYDFNTGFGGDIGQFAIMGALDLFRYSQESAALGVLDWAVGGDDDPTTASYFSLDGGATNLFGDAFFSTGAANGDGRQASHWRDVAAGATQRGIMDPTISRGIESIITGLDLAAFDAIGWNLNYDVLADPTRTFTSSDAFGLGAVPEPSTWAMMILGFGFIGWSLRRSKKPKVSVSYA